MQDVAFKQLVERIKLRSPIEEIVGARVEGLRKRGALHWARCPFHDERTPSFAVDPRRGTWRCFGACAEGGDAISFVQRFDGLSFLDALRELGRACGEEVPETVVRKRSRGEERRRDALFDVLSRARRFYAERLRSPGGEAALAYGRERGFRDETLEAFGIGWAPPHGNALLDGARTAGVDPDLLVDAGLCRRSDDGRVYDFFRGRWMIPIADLLGRPVGFGGRMLPGDTKALGKYVNTPETALFHKGRLVYGLDRARDAVRRGRHLVLVEGYTDVMAAHQAGVGHVAAVLGTATTEDHAALVRRSGATRVTLVFDGDEAGRGASLRALAGLLPLDLELVVASPPAGSDPCDLLLGAGGAEAFERMLAEARDWFGWLCSDLEGRPGPALARGVDELLGLLRRLSSPVEADARLVELAGRLGLAVSAGRPRGRERGGEGARPAPARPAADISDGAPGGGAPEDGDGAGEPGRPLDPRVRAAFAALAGALLLDNSLIPVYGDWAPRCPDPELRTVLLAILELYENGEEAERVHSGALMTALVDHPARERVVALEESARTAESPAVLARDQDAWLRRRLREMELARMRRELASLSGDPASTALREEDEGARDPSRALLEGLHETLRRERVPAASHDPNS